MYNFLPDSHRSLGSIDMFAISDRPRVVAPRRSGATAGRASAAIARVARARRAAPTVAIPTIPSSPAISPF